MRSAFDIRTLFNAHQMDSFFEGLEFLEIVIEFLRRITKRIGGKKTLGNTLASYNFVESNTLEVVHTVHLTPKSFHY